MGFTMADVNLYRDQVNQYATTVNDYAATLNAFATSVTEHARRTTFQQEETMNVTPEPERFEGYEYDEEDEYYQANDPTKAPAILCGQCLNARFEIAYDDRECIAICPCGHEIVIYRG